MAISRIAEKAYTELKDGAAHVVIRKYAADHAMDGTAEWERTWTQDTKHGIIDSVAYDVQEEFFENTDRVFEKLAKVIALDIFAAKKLKMQKVKGGYMLVPPKRP